MQTRFEASQLRDPDVAESEQILRKCVHCGFCTATCPTYVLLGDELDGPRGRIYLIKDMLENSRPASAPVVRHLDRCLSCLACMTTCPSEVNYQHLIDHARAHVERTYRRPRGERLLRAALARIVPYPRRLRSAIAAARLARAVAERMPRTARRLARGLPGSLRALMRLASYRAPRRGPDVRGLFERPVEGARRGRVALLEGCAQSVVTPGAQAACVSLLERAGFEVVRVEGCCGALAHHLGCPQRNRSLTSRLLGRLERERLRGGLDAVIVSASGCGTHMKDYGYQFRNDPALAETAASVAAKTRDIVEWLDSTRRAGAETSPRSTERGGGVPDRPGGPPAGLKVAYHSACSMQHGQRLGAVAEGLLERAGFTVEAVPEGHLCCGSAGVYNILQPALAERLRDRKLDNIRRTGVRWVATGNVGCMVQLSGEEDLQVVHTAELLDWAAGGPAPLSADARTGPARDPRSDVREDPRSRDTRGARGSRRARGTGEIP